VPPLGCCQGHVHVHDVRGVVPGIKLLTGGFWSQAATLLVVAVIFGLINATLTPLIKVVGCAFYVLTLGLAALFVTGCCRG
jgi:putative membrane protein